MYSQFKSKKESLTKQNKQDVIAKYGNEGAPRHRASRVPCTLCLPCAFALSCTLVCCKPLALELTCCPALPCPAPWCVQLPHPPTPRCCWASRRRMWSTTGLGA